MTPLLVAISLLSAAPGGPRLTGQTGSYGAPAQDSPVPIELCGHFIIVRGQVGDIADVRLLVDTGTARTVVDARLAARLELPMTASQILGLSGSVAAADIVLPPVRIGPLRHAEARALSLDLAAVAAARGCPFDVIVGGDLLRGTCFAIDYPARTLTFGCRSGWNGHVDLDPTSPYLLVETRIDGVDLRLHVDTGAPVILVHDRAAPPEWDARVTAEVNASDVAGDLRLRMLEAESIEVGSGHWGGRPVYIEPGNGPDLSYDGLIGIRALGIEEVQFDLVRMRLSWRD